MYPGDKWKYIFDFCIALLTLYYYTIIPYRIAFDPYYSSYWKLIELVFDICFFIDISLRFR